MKVFEVISEYCQGDSKEIITERQYVTSESNTILAVTAYFTKHCYEYEKDLKSVREVLTIVQHIKSEEPEVVSGLDYSKAVSV
jgi:ribosomal protein S15P/S13E